MISTRTPKPPSIFAALVNFNAANKYQGKHLSYCFRSDIYTKDPEPIKHYYTLEKLIDEELLPTYGYSIATIFCNIPGPLNGKVILTRSPAIIHVDGRELLSPNFNFYSDRFLDEISNKHKFSWKFASRMADSFADMYTDIENWRGFYDKKFHFYHTNAEMKQIISEYKIHQNSPAFQKVISENQNQ